MFYIYVFIMAAEIWGKGESDKGKKSGRKSSRVVKAGVGGEKHSMSESGSSLCSMAEWVALAVCVFMCVWEVI